jgi:hypothetical protein
MSDPLATRYRTSVAGSLRAADIGADVRLVGWVHRRRDLGGLVFLDLRDRGGLVQISFDSDWSPPEVLREARELGPEDVVQVTGSVFRRIKENPELPSGEIEVRAVEMTVLTRSEPLPIPVYRSPDEELPTEELRLRYRYLDLRRPELQANFLLRHRAAKAVRSYMDSAGFVEIETPMLTRRTPEGRARLPGSQPCTCRRVLRAPAVAPVVQAAADGQRHGSVLPDRALPSRRRSESRPSARVYADRRRDVLCGRGGRVRGGRRHGCDALARCARSGAQHPHSSASRTTRPWAGTVPTSPISASI